MAKDPDFALSPRRVHVWQVRLQASERLEVWCESVLSPEEKLRANRFVHAEHRRLFVLSHGALRALLGRYLKIAWSDLELNSSPAGKPFLGQLANGVEFNMSHSGEVAVYAFARACQLGIDVERLRPIPDMEELVALSFCEQEYVELMSVEEGRRTTAFYSLWTQKEACLKAVGGGLPLGLDVFRVSLAGERAHGGPVDAFGAQGPRHWNVHQFAFSDYVGAVAFDGDQRVIQQWSHCSVDNLMSALKLPGMA